MKPHELAATIKKNGLAPLYLLLGEEDCLRDQALDVIKAAALGEGLEAGGGTGGFNYDLLYGDETDAGEVVARASDLPVFAARRLVVLKAADRLPAREGETLLPYLKAPCATTTLVFVAPKLDGRVKFAQALREKAVTVDCSPPFETQLPAWIRAEAGRIGVRLNEDAVLVLKEVAVGSLSVARRELEKLAAYVAERGVAGPAEVMAVRGGEPGASVFDLTAAIGARDRARALGIVARNLEAGEAPVRILGSLVWQYRRIWKAKDLLRQDGAESEVARALGMAPFRFRELLGQLRLFSEAHLRAAFRLFVETDSRLKGGSGVAPSLVLESLVLALCVRAPEPLQ